MHLQTLKDALHTSELVQSGPHLQRVALAALPSLMVLCRKPNLHITCLHPALLPQGHQACAQ